MFMKELKSSRRWSETNLSTREFRGGSPGLSSPECLGGAGFDMDSKAMILIFKTFACLPSK